MLPTSKLRDVLQKFIKKLVLLFIEIEEGLFEIAFSRPRPLFTKESFCESNNLGLE